MESVWPLVAAAIVVVIFITLFIIERLVPLRHPARKLWGRLIVNGVVTGLAFAAAALLVRPAVESMLRRGGGEAGRAQFGLIHILDLPKPLQVILAFLLMDLSFYYWHLANHKAPFLWRFHNVHHIDPDLDVSTGFRFHSGEVAMSALFRVVQVAGIGVSVWTFAAYEIVFQANTLFHHSNVRLPITVERALNRFLVTPRMHGIHHSQIRNETNSNYSVVFPWWDWLHRTLQLNIPQSEVTVGVPGYARPEDNRITQVLIMPFRKQREYWQTEDGAELLRDPELKGARRNRLES